GSGDLKPTSAPVSIQPGMTTPIAVGGQGLGSGTTFEVLNPGFHRTSDFTFGPNFTRATFHVDGNISDRSAVILVHEGNDMAALTGALRIDGGGGGPLHPRAVGK